MKPAVKALSPVDETAPAEWAARIHDPVEAEPAKPPVRALSATDETSTSVQLAYASPVAAMLPISPP